VAVITDFWIESGDLRLHGLFNNGLATEKRPSLLFVPGLWGTANQFASILEAILPTRGYALSLRGRGESDAPEAGYSLEDHIDDMEAFAAATDLKRFSIVTVSAGASYAIAFAAKYCDRLDQLIFTDYPPISKSYPVEMIQGVLSSVKNVPIKEKFLRGLQRDSRAIDLAKHLEQIKCPVTILKGALEGSYLTEEHAKTYLSHLAEAKIVEIPGVAHDPLENQPQFLETLLSALNF
jgi:pimeloyl-ACP methyl ester carboxylesterase